MAYRIHIKRRHKGHFNCVVGFAPQRFDLDDERELAYQKALNECLLTRTAPLLEVSTPSPAFGLYPILDKELELRQLKRDEMTFLPWPSKPERGLYSREIMENDLHMISLYEASITEAISRGDSAIHSMRAYKLCEIMRVNCKSALMRTVAILQAKDAERDNKTRPTPMTSNGLIVPPAVEEHYRRLAHDKAYLMRFIEAEDNKRREHDDKRNSQTQNSA